VFDTHFSHMVAIFHPYVPTVHVQWNKYIGHFNVHNMNGPYINRSYLAFLVIKILTNSKAVEKSYVLSKANSTLHVVELSRVCDQLSN
jgi:hypothetical protein